MFAFAPAISVARRQFHPLAGVQPVFASVAHVGSSAGYCLSSPVYKALFVSVKMVFSEIVGTLSFLQPQADDDMSDRLNYYYTSTFLLVTAVSVLDDDSSFE